jgi:hypothetical protein
MALSWQFFAVHATTSSGFTWQWHKQGTAGAALSAPFDFYFDCVSDARRRGYAGPLPAGPKVPVLHLPVDAIDTRVASTVPPSKGHDGVMMSVKAISAIDARTRSICAAA